MSYILSAQRDVDNPDEARRLWNLYQEYLRENPGQVPAGGTHAGQQ
jgi:hypothetical protein